MVDLVMLKKLKKERKKSRGKGKCNTATFIVVRPTFFAFCHVMLLVLLYRFAYIDGGVHNLYRHNSQFGSLYRRLKNNGITPDFV